MRRWNTKDALDALWIADGNLNVILHAEGRPSIQWRPLDKYSLDRVERGLSFLILKTMKIIQHCAIQIVPCPIGLVLWERDTRLLVELLKPNKCSFSRPEATTGGEVEAIPQIDHCANYRRLANRLWLTLRRFASKFQPTQRISLPEINPRAKPVVIIMGREKRAIIESVFRLVCIAAVIAQYEGCREVMQLT
jgi:hypothetical protein